MIDGTGAPGFKADVRIKDGLIAEVGLDLKPDGETEIDAKGAFVTPGFIDSHTHLDGAMFWAPDMHPIPGLWHDHCRDGQLRNHDGPPCRPSWARK